MRSSDLISYGIYALIAGAGLIGLLLRSIAAGKRAKQAIAFAEQEGFTIAPGADSQPAGGFDLEFNDDPDMVWETPFGYGIVTASQLVNQLGGCIPHSSGYKADNVLVKREGDVDWCVFDYTTVQRDTRGRRSFGYYGVLLARVPFEFPRVELRPESLAFRLGRALGMQDIEVEVEQFNRKYFVTAADRKFAFDLLSPKVVDQMLRFPTRHWQFDGSFVVILRSDFYDYFDALRAMEEIREVLQDLEPFVKRDHAIDPKWEPLLQ